MHTEDLSGLVSETSGIASSNAGGITSSYNAEGMTSSLALAAHPLFS